MPKINLSANVRQIIFQYIDSVELLEVLFYLRDHGSGSIGPEIIAKELRSTPSSILVRLNH